MAAENSFSLRDWSALVVGICWGAVLARFFASGDMTGPWLVILFGPPLALLIAPARSLLGWQVPICAAVIVGTLGYRDPAETAGMVAGEALATWLLCSILSLPWVLIFRRWHPAARPFVSSSRAAAANIGVGFLVFLCCALIVLGFALVVQSDGHSLISSDPPPLAGFLLTTVGAFLSVASYGIASKRGIGKPVGNVLELVLVLASAVGIVSILRAPTLRYFPSPWNGASYQVGIWFTLATLESVAVLIWLVHAMRRSPNVTNRAQRSGEANSI